MTLLVAIDDTDNIDSEMGTGRVARRLADELAGEFAGLETEGVVRQQLLVDPRVPYTTHNSSATIIATGADDEREAITDYCGDYLLDIMADGSDPGLCVADADAVPAEATAFGERAQNEVVHKDEAYGVAAEADLFLDEYGGTGDGVIGALSGVGLTAGGESGRYVDYGSIREFTGTVSASALRADGIRVVADDGDEVEDATVDTRDWVRPDLRGGAPTLVVEEMDAVWVASNATDR